FFFFFFFFFERPSYDRFFLLNALWGSFFVLSRSSRPRAPSGDTAEFHPTHDIQQTADPDYNVVFPERSLLRYLIFKFSFFGKPHVANKEDCKGEMRPIQSGEKGCRLWKKNAMFCQRHKLPTEEGSGAPFATAKEIPLVINYWRTHMLWRMMLRMNRSLMNIFPVYLKKLATR
ncbi:uncharacterized protein TM35_000181820, partial [Trypanosoma theileri]